MVSDIKLDGETVIVEGLNIKAHILDLDIDHPNRRKQDKPTSARRRALVHDSQDGLTINFAEDYPGGVTINGNVQIPNKLVVHDVQISDTLISEGNVHLKTSGFYDESSYKPEQGTQGYVVERGTRTVSIENGKILIHSKPAPGLVSAVGGTPPEEYTYDIASEIYWLKRRVEDLEKRLGGQ